MPLSEEGGLEIVDSKDLSELVFQLGVQETPEMTALRKDIVNKLQDPEQLEQARSMYITYEDYAMAMVNQNPDVKAQIAFLLLKAAIWREADDADSYDEHLYDAMVTANNAGLGAVVEAIRKIRG